MNVNPVQQWTRYSGKIFLYLSWSAFALFLRIAPVAARTGIHRANEHEICRILDCHFCTGYVYLLIFQWLSEHFQNISCKFRQFIEEQYSVMGERNLTGFYLTHSTSDKCRIRNCMMW